MIRKLNAVLFALTLAAAFAAGQTGVAAPASAAAAGIGSTGKIGIIDIQTAILATNEGQKEFTALQTKFQPKKTDLEGKQKDLEALQKQLDTQGSVMAEDARATLVKQVEQKKKDLQREYEDAQSDFDSQKNDILRTLGNKVYATIDKYAKENNFAVIVDVSNPQTPVLWAAASTNITKQIVDNYNVASGVPAPAAPKPASTTAPKPAARPSGGTQ